MTLKPLGDSAWLVEFPGKNGAGALSLVTGLVESLKNNRPAGVLDVVPSFASVAVHYGDADGLEIQEWIGTAHFERQMPTGQEKEIPVCYGGDFGPDLAEIAAASGMTAQDVIALHSEASYTVAAVGFSPGFPYLLGLPEKLHFPRRSTPRSTVPAGSVAIAGGQAGIYPFTSPAGWHVLGLTRARLFDSLANPPALLQPGDRVRFVPIENLLTEERYPVPEVGAPTGPGSIEVIEPGALTTVQDLGRPGYEAAGVSPGGAADPHALRLANRLVANPDGAAGLEICVSGPVLKFLVETVVAFVSATGRPIKVSAGETVDFSKLKEGVRAYVAIAGGVLVPEIMGSSSTDLRSGFGGFLGRPLKTGDRLETGTAQTHLKSGNWHVGRAGNPRAIELRFIPGVQQHWFSDRSIQQFAEGAYQLSPKSDRMGARLSGTPLELLTPRELVSQPVACGSVQVPPDGQPIVLMAERQTIGGYPQIGHVISVDLPKLARAWPGTAVKFRQITLEEAWELRIKEERDFDLLRTGLDLLR